MAGDRRHDGSWEVQVPAPIEAVPQRGFSAATEILCGSVAGVIGKVVEYPFDTVKVRLQAQRDDGIRYAGPLDCFKKAVQQDGLKSLYRGLSAPLIGAAIETSTVFFSVLDTPLHDTGMLIRSWLTRAQYQLAQTALQRSRADESGPLSLSELVACGAVSGVFTSVVQTPVELIKCKMQAPVHVSSSASSASASGSASLNSSSPLRLAFMVYRSQGIRGFWHGQLGTLIRETGGSAAWFGSYEGVKLLFSGGEQAAKASLYQQLVAGAVAGMTYNFLCYPADTVKSRMQTEEVATASTAKQTFWSTSQSLWRRHGLAGFYRGCGITVARSAPSSAIIFASYEALRDLFG